MDNKQNIPFKNLKELIRDFSDEQKCIDFLVQHRWHGSPVCPYCNSNKWYSIENGRRFKCGNKECYKKYSVTVGTVFHGSHIPLSTWFPAVYLISAHKKGISSCQLARDLGTCQKTAWFMLHRIRESLRSKDSVFLKNLVEIDEVYIGGRVKNMSNKKRAAIKESGSIPDKEMIVGMIERDGELRLEVSPNSQKHNISDIVYKNVDKTASLMTDGEGSYITIGKHYKAHESVNHAANEYVREGFIHTNTIEGVFGLLKRSIIGVYHKMSPKHLSRYCDELQYRYNTRELKDNERFENLLGKVESRLTWKELIKDNGKTSNAIIDPKIPEIPTIPEIGKQGKKRAVCQILNGQIIATYPSIVEAEKVTGILKESISGVVRGINKSTGGYQWKYAD